MQPDGEAVVAASAATPFILTASSARWSSSRVKIQLAPGTDVRGAARSCRRDRRPARGTAVGRRPSRSRTRRHRHAVPVGGADQAEVARVGVAGALQQVAAAGRDERDPDRAGQSRVVSLTRPPSAIRHGSPPAACAAPRCARRTPRHARCGVRRREVLGARPSCERSVKSRASRPSPSSRPNGGGGAPPGLPSGTVPTKRASLRSAGASAGRRSALERKSRRDRRSAVMADG